MGMKLRSLLGTTVLVLLGCSGYIGALSVTCGPQLAPGRYARAPAPSAAADRAQHRQATPRRPRRRP